MIKGTIQIDGVLHKLWWTKRNIATEFYNINGIFEMAQPIETKITRSQFHNKAKHPNWRSFAEIQWTKDEYWGKILQI